MLSEGIERDGERWVQALKQLANDIMQCTYDRGDGVYVHLSRRVSSVGRGEAPEVPSAKGGVAFRCQPSIEASQCRRRLEDHS